MLGSPESRFQKVAKLVDSTEHWEPAGLGRSRQHWQEWDLRIPSADLHIQLVIAGVVHHMHLAVLHIGLGTAG